MPIAFVYAGQISLHCEGQPGAVGQWLPAKLKGQFRKIDKLDKNIKKHGKIEYFTNQAEDDFKNYSEMKNSCIISFNPDPGVMFFQ